MPHDIKNYVAGQFVTSTSKFDDINPVDGSLTGRVHEADQATVDWAVRAARAALHRHLIEAQRAGQRCALVVHGRGLRSREGPVLKRTLPAWLADAKVARLVLAFAPARPEDGGEGASYVLLRRSRG